PDVVIVEAPPAVVRRRSPLAGAALIAVAVAAVTGVVMWRPTGSAPPPAVVVYGGEVATSDGRVARAPTPPRPNLAIAEEPSSTTEVATPTVEPARPATASTQPVAPARRPAAARRVEDPYRAALARKQRSIDGCFNRHAAEISGSPRLALDLDIDRRGRVTAARVDPAELGPTDLGRCLLAIARDVRFAAGEADVAVS